MNVFVKRDGGKVVGTARAMQYEVAELGDTLVPLAGWDATPVAEDSAEVAAYLKAAPPDNGTREDLDAAIDALPQEQQAPFRLLLKLLGG